MEMGKCLSLETYTLFNDKPLSTCKKYLSALLYLPHCFSYKATVKHTILL